MNQVVRVNLSQAASNKLIRYRSQVLSNTVTVDHVWKNFKKSQANDLIENILVKMTFPKGACMYCNVNEANAIEHFWPKSTYSQQAFEWDNLLYICSECNTRKGNQFPVDENGNTILINPSNEDPWDYIILNPYTGQLIPKGASIRAASTIGIIGLDREFLQERYRNCCDNLTNHTNDFLNGRINSQEFVSRFIASDTYGLRQWLIKGLGNNIQPFLKIKTFDINAYNQLLGLC